MNIYKFIKNKEGFTLLETLVAVTILMMGIVGALSIVSSGLSAAFAAKDQITAFYLTFEAAEYIKNIRDSNSLAGSPWLSGDMATCMGASGCTIDMSVISPTVNACPIAGECAPLKYDPSDNFYKYGSGNETTFVRTVKVTETVANVEAIIDVTMTWKTGGLDHSFSIRENMFNWQRQFNP